jgi:hydroxyethylthiazole kinase
VVQNNLPHHAGDILKLLREQKPHIHVMTNPVAQTISANALLALGVVPSMTSDRDESSDFILRAKSVLINLGMLESVRRDAIESCTHLLGRWVLDPVKIDVSLRRLVLAQKLVRHSPTVVKTNMNESAMLFMGMDALSYAQNNRIVLAVTGEQDTVTDGTRSCIIGNGHPYMAQSTAIGCVAGAIITACLAVEDDAYLATVAGLLITGVAGEIGAANAKGPGTFPASFVDALAALTGEMLLGKAKIA